MEGWPPITLNINAEALAQCDVLPTHAHCKCIAKTLRTPLHDALPGKTWDAPVFDWSSITARDDEDFRREIEASNQAIISAFQLSSPLIGVFHEEKPMYRPRNYKIQEIGGSMNYDDESRVHIEVSDIPSLPAALVRLAQLGYDMAPSLKALEEACEEQRKRKALDEAIKGMTQKAE